MIFSSLIPINQNIILFIILLIFAIISFILLISVILYYPILKILTKSKKPNLSKIFNFPKITLIIPTYNEEKNIEKKLKNTLELDYPREKFDIIVVDGNSFDKTVEKAKQFNVKIIQLMRRGKIRQINTGVREAKTKLIVISDANINLDKDILKKAVKYLSKNIAAVGGTFRSIPSATFYAKGKADYHKKDWYERHLESLLYSTCSLDGNFILFDKTKIEEINQEAFTDDLEMTIQLIKKGYRCIITPDCMGSEPMSISLIQEINQMRRRIKLTIANAFQHLDLIFNKKYKQYGLFIFPLHRFFNMFVPFYLLFIGIFLLLYSPLVLTIIITLGITASLYKNMLFYYNILVIATILAWFDILMGNLKKGCIWK